ncbi:protein Eaa [Salmonella enterica subsp. enterica serovar Schwarzengrund]|nr:protein Eaa [Salmonella enterica subsp. enterica serovar Schwarzengrund]
MDHGYRPECECSGCKATARICAELNNEEAEIFADGYNAAMQSFGNSEQLNSPVTPDGWISCSERMPDSKTGVLVAREFGRKGDWRMKWGTYVPGHPDAQDGWIIPGASWLPTHWMPLPEPPQH